MSNDKLTPEQQEKYYNERILNLLPDDVPEEQRAWLEAKQKEIGAYYTDEPTQQEFFRFVVTEPQKAAMPEPEEIEERYIPELNDMDYRHILGDCLAAPIPEREKIQHLLDEPNRHTCPKEGLKIGELLQAAWTEPSDKDPYKEEKALKQQHETNGHMPPFALPKNKKGSIKEAAEHADRVEYNRKIIEANRRGSHGRKHKHD